MLVDNPGDAEFLEQWVDECQRPQIKDFGIDGWAVKSDGHDSSWIDGTTDTGGSKDVMSKVRLYYDGEVNTEKNGG